MLTKFLLFLFSIISSFFLIHPGKDEFVQHKIIQSDSIPIILQEKVDSNNNTIWYEADIETEVCREGLCEIAHITIYWDEIGDFLKFTLPDGRDLTKYDHKPFNTDDYRKLANILADTASLLKEISYNEINDIIERAQEQVDAVTGATPGELANAVVRDAAFSTYTFWHIVYGASRDTIINHLGKKTNADFVLEKLKNEASNIKIWAIKKARENYKNNSEVKQEVLKLLSNSDFEVASQSLRFFTNEELEEKKLQQSIVNMFPEMEGIMKFELLYRLKKLNEIQQETFTFLLNEFIENRVGVSAYTHIVQLAELVKAPDENSIGMIEQLLYHDNFYVARKAYDYLKSYSSNERQLAKNLKKFENKYADRLN